MFTYFLSCWHSLLAVYRKHNRLIVTGSSRICRIWDFGRWIGVNSLALVSVTTMMDSFMQHRIKHTAHLSKAPLVGYSALPVCINNVREV